MRNLKPWRPIERGDAILGALLLAAAAVSLCSCRKTENPAVRIGWQTAWATQGQLAAVLQRTDVLARAGLRAQFTSFTYGAPMSEAALAGRLDVVFLGDQPAVNLLSRSKDWCVVARLLNCRAALIVPPRSPIREVADLKGKTVGIPFGSGAHRVAVELIEQEGLNPQRDLKLVNLDITEQSDVVKTAGGKTPWPGIDAFASWDHHVASYEHQGYARVLKSKNVLGVVLMSRRFVDRHPQEAAAMLAAFKLAYYYYALHADTAGRWVSEAAGGRFDLSAMKIAETHEPNLEARRLDDIRIDIGPEQLDELRAVMGFAVLEKLIPEPFDILPHVCREPLAAAEGLLANRPPLIEFAETCRRGMEE